MIIVNGRVDEVLVGRSRRSACRSSVGRAAIGEARQGISKLEVQILDATERAFDVVHQFHVHGVIDGTADRIQKDRRSYVRIYPLERAPEAQSGVAASDTEVGSGIETVTGVASDRGSGEPGEAVHGRRIQRAIDRRRAERHGTSELRVGYGNRLLRVREIEIFRVYVATVIRVNSNQVVHVDVAKIINA